MLAVLPSAERSHSFAYRFWGAMSVFPLSSSRSFSIKECDDTLSLSVFWSPGLYTQAPFVFCKLSSRRRTPIPQVLKHNRLYSGNQFKPNPPKLLCSIQASLVYSSTIMFEHRYCYIEVDIDSLVTPGQHLPAWPSLWTSVLSIQADNPRCSVLFSYVYVCKLI